MSRRLVYIVITLLATPAARVSAYAQSEFDSARALLQKVDEDRAAYGAIADTKRISDGEVVAARKRVSEEEQAAPAKVEGLLNAAVLRFLDTDAHRSPEKLQAKLREALQIGPEQPEHGVNAQAFVFQIGPAKKGYIVAYNIVHCITCSHSWIGAFAPKGGGYELVASLDNSLPNQTLQAVPLWTGDNVIRFLAYGINWGDAHSRLNAAAYSFDGHQIREVWSRTGLPQGTLKLEPGTMVVSFLTALVPPWKMRTETYAVTANEIHLLEASESPVE